MILEVTIILGTLVILLLSFFLSMFYSGKKEKEWLKFSDGIPTLRQTIIWKSSKYNGTLIQGFITYDRINKRLNFLGTCGIFDGIIFDEEVFMKDEYRLAK